jgi:hypothetical protein
MSSAQLSRMLFPSIRHGSIDNVVAVDAADKNSLLSGASSGVLVAHGS